MRNGPTLPMPEEVLPHRAPFLFVDEVLSCDEEGAVARRLFKASEPFFQGHFPERALVPGVILIEGLAQTLAYWALREQPGHLVLLTGVNEAKFNQVVQPGDEVTFTLQVLKARRGLVVAQGTCHVSGQRVAQAQIKGFLQPSTPEEA